VAKDSAEAVEPVVMATDQQARANEAAGSPLTRVAAALERSDQSYVGHEQRQPNEDRETTLARKPKQRSQDGKYDPMVARSATLDDLAIEGR
jgi:hypothetical protein